MSTINFRLDKGSALTHEELDVNFASLIYSASFNTSNSTLTLHFTGSSNVTGSSNLSIDLSSITSADLFPYIGNTVITGSLVIVDSNNIAVATLSGSQLKFYKQVSGSAFSGSFYGDGSDLTGIAASSVAFTNITGKPALVSGSSQISYTGITNTPSGLVSGSNQISYTGITNIPSGILSSSAQINGAQVTGVVSASYAVTSSYALNAGGGGTLSNIVEDTTPQLGGNLDAQNYNISSIQQLTSSFAVVTSSLDIGLPGTINNTLSSGFNHFNKDLGDSIFHERIGIGSSQTPATTVHIRSATDDSVRIDHTSSTGNPTIDFYQSGSQRSFIQHNDTGDTLILASEYGGMEFKTGTSGSETTRLTISSGGVLKSLGVLNNGIITGQDVYVDSSGELGYIESRRESKTNIKPIKDIKWLEELNPVEYNYRLKDKENNVYLEDYHNELEYGLIAEEVEGVNRELVSYDFNEKIKTVYYRKLVTPLLVGYQQLKREVEDLKKELEQLKQG